MRCSWCAWLWFIFTLRSGLSISVFRSWTGYSIVTFLIVFSVGYLIMATLFHMLVDSSSLSVSVLTWITRFHGAAPSSTHVTHRKYWANAWALSWFFDFFVSIRSYLFLISFVCFWRFINRVFSCLKFFFIFFFKTRKWTVRRINFRIFLFWKATAFTSSLITSKHVFLSSVFTIRIETWVWIFHLSTSSILLLSILNFNDVIVFIVRRINWFFFSVRFFSLNVESLNLCWTLLEFSVAVLRNSCFVTRSSSR